ncbi:bacillithiol biosynthesis cysteine-adding enzyme BshC [Paenibacillus thermoaerophilus]|uniref:Putative cysteine ligase BshC n=1 Tax=Paenibacillus thermoaerophilus TaxID=1215385 RepID=A0ABW2V329_9BACL|nr:bacillithiol biosynthesis cysteine-adding enzyme BshC [Paenibacillus thermoaerophilus]
MQIEPYVSLPKPPLARDYLERFERVASLYEYDLRDAGAERRRVVWLDEARGEIAADREAIAKAVADYNRRVGNAPEAVDAALSLASPVTLAVAGGQQGGLFGGPMLTLFKAVTILQEARERSLRLGRPVVPVFWIAGEDHDWDEVNHTYVQSPEGGVTKLRMRRPADAPRASVSAIGLPEENWREALEELRANLPDTEFKPAMLDALRSGDGDSLTFSFARLLAALFGKHGLVLVDSADPALRRLESKAFARILRRNREIEAALAEGEAEVRSLGYEPQLAVQPGQANVFLLHEGERTLLFRDGAVYRNRRGTLACSEDELLALADEEPERFSNNVVTRPWMQDVLFPTVSVVLGPSEIAYWGMLRGVFAALGGQMPILVPRLEFTLIEGTVQKAMRKFGLSAADAMQSLDEKQAGWLAAQDGYRFADRLAEVKRQVAELYAPIVRDAEEVNPGLRKLAETNLDKIGQQIDFFAAKAEDALKTRHEAALRQWDRIRHAFLPLGKPQERVYNGSVFLNKYGTDWLHELTAANIPRDGVHRFVYI